MASHGALTTPVLCRQGKGRNEGTGDGGWGRTEGSTTGLVGARIHDSYLFHTNQAYNNVQLSHILKIECYTGTRAALCQQMRQHMECPNLKILNLK